jgi:NAD(P)-dependent dehydrogenase (short-subunit alcohol dehydrogenase family)
MLADMSGRAALITGAASGIGRASAIAFVAAGASVALVDIDAGGLQGTAAAVKAAGHRAEVFVADVADLRAVTTAVEDAAGVFGRLDAAHNNAGVPGPYVPLDTTGLAHDADWYPLALAAWVVIWGLAAWGYGRRPGRSWRSRSCPSASFSCSWE